MEIILKKDTSSIGKMGSVVKVADGFARNYLIPQGIGVEATPENLKRLEKEMKSWVKRAAEHKEEAVKLSQEIEKLTLTFARKSGEEDKLFGSVTSMDIEDRFKENGIQINRKIIHLEEPIKTLGTFTVPIKLHPEVTANLNVIVTKEQ